MKRLIKIIVLVLVVSGLATGVVEASSNLNRIYGGNRIETSIEISKKAYPGKAGTVVLSGYHGEVDALSGIILAHGKDAPILITGKDKLDPSVKARMEELGASNVYLLGGKKVISQDIEDKLEQLGYTVSRISGGNRESTAIEIAKEVKGENIGEVFITLGYGDYADALAINPETGKQSKPIFLTKTDELSSSTKEGLKNLGVKKATIIGGNAVVSKNVENQLETMGIGTDRVEGKNRFDTALNIAKEYAKDSNGFLVANGYNYADALIGGYFSIKENKPILLVNDDRISKSNIDYLREKRLETFILGGETVVGKEVYRDIDIALKDPVTISDLSVNGTTEVYSSHKIKVETNIKNEVVYKFYVKHEEDKNWTILQDYSSSNSVDWVPEENGEYHYKVEAKYLNSKYIEAEKTDSTTIVPLKPAEITNLELLGNKYKNTKHTIVAEATSTNDVLYKFYVRDESVGKWEVLQDYSRKNTADWTPKTHGKYRYTVRVKDIMSEEDYDNLEGHNVNINPPIYYHTTRYEDTLDQALKKQGGTKSKKGGGWEKATKADIKRYMDPARFLQFQPKGVKKAVSSGSLNVRKGPGGEYEKIGTIKEGEMYEILSQVNNYSKINYGNKEAWVSSTYMDVIDNEDTENHLISIEVKNNSLNMRKEANSSSTKVGTVSKGDVYIVLEEEKGWQKINAKGKEGWISSSYTEYVNDVPKEMYQFMILSGQAGVTPAQMNKELKGMGILDGKGEYFIEASKKYNINELYLMAHSMLETGRGTSRLATGIEVTKVNGEKVEPKVVYNMYGIGAKDRDAERLGSEYAYEQGWFTPEKAIVEGAAWIGDNYINSSTHKQDTLYKMRYNAGGAIWHQYATDVAWAWKQRSQIQNIMDYAKNMENIVLKFDIPQYKNK